jgi:hypothetical protein
MGGSNPAKVKVIVRVRPLLSHEPNTPCVYVQDSDQVRLVLAGRSESYGFKYVLSSGVALLRAGRGCGSLVGCGGLWWVVVGCGGLWWVVVGCGGL